MWFCFICDIFLEKSCELIELYLLELKFCGLGLWICLIRGNVFFSFIQFVSSPWWILLSVCWATLYQTMRSLCWGKLKLLVREKCAHLIYLVLLGRVTYPIRFVCSVYQIFILDYINCLLQCCCFSRELFAYFRGNVFFALL